MKTSGRWSTKCLDLSGKNNLAISLDNKKYIYVQSTLFAGARVSNEQSYGCERGNIQSSLAVIKIKPNLVDKVSPFSANYY